MNTNLNVNEPDLPFAEFELYIHVNFYTALVNCGVLVGIFFLVIYITCKMRTARKALDDLPVYLGLPPSLPKISRISGIDITEEKNPPYFSTTTSVPPLTLTSSFKE